MARRHLGFRSSLKGKVRRLTRWVASLRNQAYLKKTGSSWSDRSDLGLHQLAFGG